mgnify:CR=1 FL=1
MDGARLLVLAAADALDRHGFKGAAAAIGAAKVAAPNAVLRVLDAAIQVGLGGAGMGWDGLRCIALGVCGWIGLRARGWLQGLAADVACQCGGLQPGSCVARALPHLLERQAAMVAVKWPPNIPSASAPVWFPPVLPPIHPHYRRTAARV